MDDELPSSPHNDRGPSADAGSDDVWLVSFSETDDRELTVSEISKALNDGAITGDTIVWREGMPQWQRISQVPELTNSLNRVPGADETSATQNESTSSAASNDSPTAAIGTAQGRAETGSNTGGEPDAAPPAAASSETTPTDHSDARATEPLATQDARTEIVLPGGRTRSTTALGIGTVQREGSRDRGSTALGIGRGRTPPPLPERRRKANGGQPPRATADEPVDSGPISIVPDSIPPDESGKSDTGLPKLESVAPKPKTLDEQAPLFDREYDEEPVSIIPESLSPESIKNLPKPPDFTLHKGSAIPSLEALTGEKGDESKATSGAEDAGELDTADVLSAPDRSKPEASASEAGDGDVLDESAHDDLVALAATNDSKDQVDLSDDRLLDPPSLELKPGDPGYEPPAQEAKAEEKESGSKGVWLLVAAILGGGILWLSTREQPVNTQTRSAQPAQVEAADRDRGSVDQPAEATEPSEPEQPTSVPEEAKPQEADEPSTADQETSQPEGVVEAPSDDVATAEAPTPTPQKSLSESTPRNPATPTPAVAKPEPRGTALPKENADESPDSEAKPEPQETAPPFNKDEAAAALRSGALRASACRKEGDPSGVAKVTVTFSSSGRATRSVVEGPPFAGTQTGGCIASTMRSLTIPRFSGDRVTVSKTVTIR